jgi:chitodextrinase
MRAQKNRTSSSFACAAFLALCLALFITGCYSTSSAPPPDTIPPTAPTNLVATVVSPAQINLSWTASTDNVGVTGYKVERCQGAGCSNFAQISTSTATTFNDTGLTGSTSYSYRVRATDAAGNLSTYSAPATMATPAPTLTAPSNLAATAASSTQINLTWSASTETGGAISGYLVERCSGAGCANFAQIATPTATTYNDTGLTASTSYSYRVRATDALSNLSPYSSTATASTPASSVAVTISPLRAAVTTTQPQAFSANVTGSANTSVTWSVDTIPNGNATIGTISATGTYTPPSIAGTHTISATSVADVTKSASASIAVTDLAGVTTYHNNLSRDGANTHEFALTTATVKAATFGRLFSCATDGAIYGQPLWAPNLAIGGGSHNVIFVASSRDSVYAFDADATPCTTYWHKVLLGAGETWVSSNDVGTGDIHPDIGIVGTPVIDPVTNTIYVVTKSEDNGTGCFPSTACHQRLHALSLMDGSEKFGGPVDITSSISVSGTGDGSNAGSVPFNTLRQNQRCGLVLSAGVVYVAWASYGDNTPYHGWVIGFDKSTLQIVATFNANPNGSDSGIWMGGGAPAVDSFGNLYFLTGNGTFDADSGGLDYGDSTVKLSTAGGLSVSSWFTPADQSNLAGGDQDHGAGGAAILVDQPGAPHPRLVIGGGKEGNLFLLDRDNLGGYGANFNPVDSNAVQTLAFNNGIFATAAFWNNALYLAGAGGHLKTFSFNITTGKFNAAPTSQSSGSFGFPGSTPSVSALGTTNGIVWALDNGQYCTQQATACGPAVLHAYDATNLATELWNSSQSSADSAGHAVKFTVPTVANGKVYVGTRGSDSTAGGVGELDVYGLKPK